MDAFSDITVDDRLKQLLSYWREKRQGRLLPRRADVDPTEIPGLLPNIMLTEVTPEGRYRYRLVGTTIDVHAASQLTGRYVDQAFLAQAYADYMVGLYDLVVKDVRIVYTEGTFLADHDASPRWMKRLMMPLSSDGRSVDVVFSGQVYHFEGTGSGPLKRQDHRTWRETLRRAIDPAAV
jgi:hypothetical protein